MLTTHSDPLRWSVETSLRPSPPSAPDWPRVTEMRWRAASVETRNWETLVIPNSVLVKNQFLVVGQRDGESAPWRRWVYFNVDFRYAPTDVIAAVEAIFKNAAIPSVAAAPAPHCILVELSLIHI